MAKVEGIRMPAVVAFMQPFRLVLGKSDTWQCSIDAINNGTYDYVKLCKRAAVVDVDIRPFSMLVCVDGALVLPASEAFRTRETAAQKFNDVLAQMFLGGIYADRIEPSEVFYGEVLSTWYVRTYPNPLTSAGTLSHDLRSGEASSLHAIVLESPHIVTAREFVDAVALGQRTLRAVPDLGSEFLIQAATNLRRRSWSESLASSWILVEQITSHLWETKVIGEARAAQHGVEKRLEMLADDRTFTTGVKLEVLLQRALIDEQTLRACSVARRARNRLSHAGQHSTRGEALASFESVFRLLAMSAGKRSDEYMGCYRKHVDDHATDREVPAVLPLDAFSFWREIKALPGEKEWTDAPYEVVPGDPVRVGEEAEIEGLREDNG